MRTWSDGVASWKRQWRETDGKKLIGRIEDIVSALTDAAQEIATLVERGEREAEIRRREWDEQWRRIREEQERDRQAKARELSRLEMLQAIAAWDEVKRIHAFFTAAEADANELADPRKTKMLERLALARDLVGKVSPLCALEEWKTPAER